MTIRTAHVGSFVSSPRSSLREGLDSLDCAETNSAETKRPAMNEKRIMEWYDQSPRASEECKRFASRWLRSWAYLGLVYELS
jgi:hypothetical protein